MDAELNKILANSTVDEVPIKYITYKGMFVPETYPRIAESVENFEVRDDDVWVCSFPKCGTTWTQEMVWCIANGPNSEAAKIPLTERFPFLEFTGSTTAGWMALTFPEKNLSYHLTRSVESVANLPSPRFIKSHLPFHLLPRQLRTGEKKNKIICVARNPKDACISYYHHYKLLEAYCGTFEDFCKLFLGDKVYYAPFWDHIIGYWERKDDANMLFLKYEDMKADLPSVIRKTGAFLGKSLTDEDVKELAEHLSFNSMKENPSVNYRKHIDAINTTKMYGENFVSQGDFIRKGVAGQWKTTMSKELVKEFDEWTSKKLQNYQNLHNEFL